MGLPLRLPILGGLADGRLPAIDEAQAARHILGRQPQAQEALAHGGEVGTALRAEAAVAVALLVRAKRAAAGACDRPHAGLALGDQYADVAVTLAFHADGLARHARLHAIEQIGYYAL